MDKYKFKLSICVITMNRSAQLKEALQSCLDSELPNETEFVVIDNASTDDTEQTVKEILQDCGYPYYYEKLPENLGVGGGRNYAYDKSNGEYVYILDDDAVIDVENNRDFFVCAIAILKQYPDVVSLTTQIYDTAWVKNRLNSNLPKITDGIYKCKMLCGTSHFLRKTFFASSPYLPNKYGYEEIPPSLYAIDSGKINAFCSDIRIIHKPAVNKWDWSQERNQDLLVKEIALPYAIKSMMYPKIFIPILKLAKRKRIKLHMDKQANSIEKVEAKIVEFCNEYPISRKIRFTTVLRMFLDFGLSAF